MNKLFSLLLVAMLTLSSCAIEPMNLSFKITDKTPDGKVVVTIDGEAQDVIINENGEGSVVLNDLTPQYVSVRYGRTAKQLFLEPGKDLELSFSAKTMYKDIQFVGENAPINEYLATRINSIGYNETGVKEGAFFARVDSLLESNQNNLLAKNFPKSFTDVEKIRLKYHTLGSVPMYPIWYPSISKDAEYKASPTFFNEIKKYAIYDGSLLKYPEYKKFINTAATVLSMEESGIIRDGEVINNQLMDYILTEVKDAEVAEYLMNATVYGYVKRNGLKNPLLETNFRKVVKDELLIQEFDSLLSKWEIIKVGAVSPSFKYKDIKGKEVSLEDLRGKVVYIDLWATWCGPCLGEIPHLVKMEKKYHGKDIEIVSISTDIDKEAWKKMVAEKKLKGIQLHIDGDRSFMEAYLVSGIPRFILLDKQGRIVSANATRPSNPETETIINELLRK